MKKQQQGWRRARLDYLDRLVVGDKTRGMLRHGECETVGGVKKTPACAAGVAARGIPGESENKPGTHNWPRSTERWSQRRRGGGWCRRGGDRCMFWFNLGHFGKEPIYGDRSLASEKIRSDI